MQCHSDKGSLQQTPHLTLFAKVPATVAYKTKQGTTGQEIIHVFKQILNDRKQEMINIKVHKIIFCVCMFFVVSSIPVKVLLEV